MTREEEAELEREQYLQQEQENARHAYYEREAAIDHYCQEFELVRRKEADALASILDAILSGGELASVEASPSISSYTGGKKTAMKEVFQFPRHMLKDIKDALAQHNATPQTKGEQE